MWLVSATNNGEDETRSLYEWLRAEPELQGYVRLDPRPMGDGDLGWTELLVINLAAIISVAASRGGVLSVLAGSLKVHLAQPRRSDLHIEIHDQDSGRKVVIDAQRVSDIEPLLRDLLDQDDPDDLDQDRDDETQ